MPEGITTLTNLTSLNLHAPFSRWDALPPGFGTLPLVSLTLWHASFTGATATQELEGLTSLEVNITSLSLVAPLILHSGTLQPAA